MGIAHTQYDHADKAPSDFVKQAIWRTDKAYYVIKKYMENIALIALFTSVT